MLVRPNSREFLTGEVRRARPTVPPPTVFHEVSGKVEAHWLLTLI